ncbi:MAG TPA: amidohydrolase family protein, partial [Polyangiaceae bacterium]
MRAVHADAIITGDGGVLRDGAVVVEDDGTINDLGPAAEVLPRHAGLPVERSRGALLPGLVNAHTHLELSALRGQVTGGSGFVPWVEQMIGARAEAFPEDDAEAIEQAVAELESYGTVAVGEVSNSLSAVQSLARHGFVGRIFHEVFGIERASLEQRVADLPKIMAERVGDWPTPELEYAP